MRLYTVIAILVLASTALHAQNVKLVFDQHYMEDDKSFDGQHLAYYDYNDNPYTVDDEGLITGNWASFHENGTYESKGSLFKGEKNGLWRNWDRNGNLISEAHFHYGQKDGNWKVWSPEGELLYDMYYDEGKRVKTWKVYNENGDLIDQKSYE